MSGMWRESKEGEDREKKEGKDKEMYKGGYGGGRGALGRSSGQEMEKENRHR